MLKRESEDAEYCTGGILADEMGLGKTWETIGLLLNNPVEHTLILVPPVLQQQWAEALKRSRIAYKILCPKSSYWGQWDNSKFADARPGMDVVLATYDRATRAVDDLNAIKFSRIICDEGHALRNGKSTERFNKLMKLEAEYRWILSGTPVQNKISDLHNLLMWLQADYDKKSTPVADIASKILLRRVVDDVREAVESFPEFKPVHTTHAVVMPTPSDEKDVFDRLVRRFKDAVETKVDSFVILELYLRIRQFLAHPQIYVDAMRKKYKDAYKRASWDSSTSKMTAFQEYMCDPDVEKKPTIVFTTFRSEMDYADDILRKAGYNTWQICGGLTDSVRETAIRESREAAEKGEPVAILIQIQAGSAGLNLQHTNRIVFLSSHWNPTVMDQAIARAYRIGQTEKVEVHHILLADGAEKNLDRYIMRMHGKKRDIAKSVHEKLFCDSAVDVRNVLNDLDAVAPEDVPEMEDYNALDIDPTDKDIRRANVQDNDDPK